MNWVKKMIEDAQKQMIKFEKDKKATKEIKNLDLDLDIKEPKISSNASFVPCSGSRVGKYMLKKREMNE